jgi:hypothetical protein
MNADEPDLLSRRRASRIADEPAATIISASGVAMVVPDEAGAPLDNSTETATIVQLRGAEGQVTLLGHQPRTWCQRDEHGDLLIMQDDYPNDDTSIRIHRDYEAQFLDNLCDMLGVQSFP